MKKSEKNLWKWFSGPGLWLRGVVLGLCLLLGAKGAALAEEVQMGEEFESGLEGDFREAASAYVGVMPYLRELLGLLPETETALTCFGERVASREALERLWGEIQRLSAGGHKVSLLMMDARSRSGVSYQSRIPMCTQSTVKGVYIGSLLSQSPEVFWDCQEEIREAIMVSSNEAYANLRAWYGEDCLARWCEETGVDPSFAAAPYPRSFNARDMFRLWTRLFEFLNGGEDTFGVGEYFRDSLVSAARIQLGERYVVHSKAGWESGIPEGEFAGWEFIPPEYVDGDPLNDETAINDTGIVYTPQGPYLFVIFTDHPYGIFSNCVIENPLTGLTEALLQVQQSLQGV